MAKTHISASSKQLIIKRSKGYCEYCKCLSDFSTELFSIEGLKLNRTPVKNLRRALIAIGEHPPIEEEL